MRFINLQIKNFRNFHNININLDNRNVIFGMNDAGKTNFLYAIRFLLDKDIRKNGFLPTDYHKNNTCEKIELILTVDLSDFDSSEDTKKFIAETRDGGIRSSERGDRFYIKLEGIFNDKELFGEIIMYWGDDINNLKIIPFTGTSCSLDYIFKVVYINPLIDLDRVFTQNRRLLFDEKSTKKEDSEIIGKINDLTNQVNQEIGKMSTIHSFQTAITEEYKKLKNEDVEIEMKSEMAINGFFSDIIPYIKTEDDSNYYPTGGDGRRKMLSYSLFNYLIRKQYENKVVIYLLEEPENSLHRSMQIALSKQLFENDIYKYLFISTHSSEILYEMDEAMLIRIYSNSKIVCDSYLYNINQNYKAIKKQLNKEFTNALFSERVLLIEGPSERVLFEKVLEEMNPQYELNGGYILQVSGTYFKTYINAFKGLNIKTIVKTDNDLKRKKGTKNEYELLGLNRCLELIGLAKLNDLQICFPVGATDKQKRLELKEKKRELFSTNTSNIKKFESNNIYLSEIDLEHDLYSVIGSRMDEILGRKGEKTINYLQNRKLLNMIELIEGFTQEDCKIIYEYEKFKCLKELG